MISTISWVGRGVSKNTPIKYIDDNGENVDEEEEMAPQTTTTTDAEEKMDEEDSSAEELSEEDPNVTVTDRYNLDDYDDEGCKFLACC